MVRTPETPLDGVRELVDREAGRVAGVTRAQSKVEEDDKGLRIACRGRQLRGGRRRRLGGSALQGRRGARQRSCWVSGFGGQAHDLDLRRTSQRTHLPEDVSTKDGS